MNNRKSVLLLTVFAALSLILGGCGGPVRCPKSLLAYTVSYTGNEYSVPDTPWWSTISELAKCLRLSPSDLIPTHESSDSYRLARGIAFQEPNCTAETVHIFQDGYYIGRDLRISCQSREDFLAICSSLAQQALALPQPSSGNLEQLAAGQRSAGWQGENNNSFVIDISSGKEQGVVLLSVRAPHSHKNE